MSGCTAVTCWGEMASGIWPHMTQSTTLSAFIFAEVAKTLVFQKPNKLDEILSLWIQCCFGKLRVQRKLFIMYRACGARATIGGSRTKSDYLHVQMNVKAIFYIRPKYKHKYRMPIYMHVESDPLKNLNIILTMQFKTKTVFQAGGTESFNSYVNKSPNIRDNWPGLLAGTSLDFHLYPLGLPA